MQYDTNGDGISPDYDFFMPSGKGVYLGVVNPIPNAGQVNAIQSVNLRPANYTALGFAPPHDPGPRSETDLIDSDPSMPDALVYPYETIPSPILAGTSESITWLSYDGLPNRGYNGFTDVSGLPDIGVPAGFTRVVYDRTTRGSSEDLALNPPAVRREVALPFSVHFIGRPWSEPVLLEIASGYEHARGPRIPPPDFGPLPGEPSRAMSSIRLVIPGCNS